MKISSTLALVVAGAGRDGRARRRRCARRRRQELGRPAPERRAARLGAARGDAAGRRIAAGDAGAARRDPPRQARDAGRRRPRRRACRAGSARSPASPRASGSPRCCRISACRKASERSCCSRCSRSASCSRCACCSRGARRPREPLAYAAPPRAGTAPAFEKSATPEWGGAQRIEPVLGAAGAAPAPARSLPPGFDAAGFVKHAKQQFVALQAAHDAGDRAALRDVLTPEMYAEMVRDLDSGPRPATEVVEPRRRGARGHDRRRPALGERPVHRHDARGRRRSRRPSTKSGTCRSPSTARRAGSSPASSSTPERSALRSDALRPRRRPGGARQPRARARDVGALVVSPRTPGACSRSRSGPSRRRCASTPPARSSRRRRPAARPTSRSRSSPLDGAGVPRGPDALGRLRHRRRRRRARGHAEGSRGDAAVVRRAGVCARRWARSSASTSPTPGAGCWLSRAMRASASARAWRAISATKRRWPRPTAEARSIGDEIAAIASRVDALAARIDALAARIAAPSSTK